QLGPRGPREARAQALAERGRFRSLAGRGERPPPVEPLEGARRVAPGRPPVRRLALEARQGRPERAGTVEKRERLLLRRAVRLIPEKIREGNQRLEAVRLRRESSPVRRRRLCGPAVPLIDAPERERGLGVSGRKLERPSERLARGLVQIGR